MDSLVLAVCPTDGGIARISRQIDGYVVDVNLENQWDVKIDGGKTDFIYWWLYKGLIDGYFSRHFFRYF